MTTLPAPPGDRVDRRRRPVGSRTPITTVILVAVVIGVSVASVLLGSRWMDPGAVFDTDHPVHGIAAARIDRTLLGLCVGAALGLVGALMQGLTRNLLADPGILGINAGASFAMVLTPSEVQVGIMTAVVGVPVFLTLVRRGRIGAL